MGGMELGYSSDLDLVFVHDCQLTDNTNGSKVISAAQFYAKLAQRMMHIFNTRMSNGLLFELDLRLRPSGNSGVLVVNIDTFAQYQQNDAWTWEHQALVRARGVAGDSQILAKFFSIRQLILAIKREQQTLKQEVIAMRNKMRQHLDKSTSDHYDIKQGAGGLVDIEFLAQYLVLNNSQYYPEISQYSDNLGIFNALANVKIITKKEKLQLISRYCQLRDYGHRQSLHYQVNHTSPTDILEQAKSIETIYTRFLS
jgi:glutamate-ammonia-ligase adenylyltransferase